MNTPNNTIRLLVTNHNTASYNMALDEAIMNHVKDGTVPPTLRLYQWNPPEKNQIVTGTNMESYRQICGAVIVGLQQFGLAGQFVPINDILVNDKKISGNAQTRRNGCILQHGTILMDV